MTHTLYVACGVGVLALDVSALVFPTDDPNTPGGSGNGAINQAPRAHAAVEFTAMAASIFALALASKAHRT